MTTTPAPTPTRDRIDALDVVRGVAVLGILLLNVQSMGMPLAADRFPPPTSWTPADQAVWWVNDVFVRGTMRGLSRRAQSAKERTAAGRRSPRRRRR